MAGNSDNCENRSKPPLPCIEVLQQTLADPEDAFRMAVNRMGDQTRLAREFSKNRSLLSTLCLLRGSGQPNLLGEPRSAAFRLGLLTVFQSIVWAVVIVAAGWTLSGTEYRESVSNWPLAGWFASVMLPMVLLNGGSAKAECAWVRHRFGFSKR